MTEIRLSKVMFLKLAKFARMICVRCDDSLINCPCFFIQSIVKYLGRVIMTFSANTFTQSWVTICDLDPDLKTIIFNLTLYALSYSHF